MNAIERSQLRRMQSGFSRTKMIRVGDETISIADAAARLALRQELSQVRWEVFAKAFEADMQSGNPELREFWAGEAGATLRELNDELAALPGVWGELRQAQDSTQLGAIPLVVWGIAALAGGGLIWGGAEASEKVISAWDKEDYLREERLSLEADLRSRYLDHGLAPPANFGAPGNEEKGFFSKLSEAVGGGTILGAAGLATGYVLWKKSKKGVEYVGEKIRDRRQSRQPRQRGFLG